MSWANMVHAVLPSAEGLPLWVKLSWALVLSAGVLRLTQGKRNARWVVCGLSFVLLLPGPDVLTGYLALAFQTPSLVGVVWALGIWLVAMQAPSNIEPQTEMPTVPPLPPVPPTWPVALLGVLLGWALVVDTLNLWPAWIDLQLYALGFSAYGLWAVLAVMGLVVLGLPVSTAWVIRLGFVLSVYVGLRLPTGNVWDALLDPFVWVALHLQLWRAWCARPID